MPEFLVTYVFIFFRVSFLRSTEENHDNTSQGSGFPGQDLKIGPPIYDVRRRLQLGTGTATRLRAGRPRNQGLILTGSDRFLSSPQCPDRP
jgi:hypothetical protein